MKNFLKILLFFLVLGQMNAQGIPTNPAVTVSYNSEIITYKQVANTADLNLLNDFEKLTFKLQKEFKTVQKYLDRQNETTTVITYGAREGFEGTSDDNVKKVIMDKNGVFSYGAQNQVLASQMHSAKAIAMENEIKQGMSAANFEVIPDYSSPTTEMMQSAQANGYQVSNTGGVFSVRSASDAFTFDSNLKMLESKSFQNGRPVSISQTFYAVPSPGQKVPTLKIERSYETSEKGVLVELVRVEKITNFIRTSR